MPVWFQKTPARIGLKIEVGGSLYKRLLFTGNYYHYDMCCLKRNVSAPKRLIDSKVCCPLSFHLNYYNCNENTIQKHEA